MNYGSSKKYFVLLLLISLFSWSCRGTRSLTDGPGTGTTAAAAIVVPPPAKSLTPLPARELSREGREMRGRAMAAAVKLRGLDFTGGVGMTELTGWEYGTRSREMAELLGGDDLRSLTKLAVAGGMLPPGTDLATLASGFAAISAGAIYSPFDKQILLVTKFKDDSLITHEYVHALQDEHFDLLKLLTAKPFDFDRTEAAFALVEGDAVNVQRRLENKEAVERSTLDEIYQREDNRFGQYRKEMGALFPPLLTETFVFRYRDGARFVEAVRRNKKSGGLDAVFRQPPLSTEQIIHPEKYFARELPVEISLDIARYGAQGWTLINSSPLGEIGIRGQLMASLADKTAARAAAGWGGDRAFLFENAAGAPLFVWKSRWDTEKDAEEFYGAYIQTLRENSGGEQSERNEAGTLWIGTDRRGVRTFVQRQGKKIMILRGNYGDENLRALATEE